jgi:hypothetical protein
MRDRKEGYRKVNIAWKFFGKTLCHHVYCHMSFTWKGANVPEIDKILRLDRKYSNVILVTTLLQKSFCDI